MKNFKKFAAIAAVTAMGLTACSGGDKGGSGSGSEGGSGAEGKDFKACIVSDAGGWDDRSFNESAKVGLDEAVKELGIKSGTAESSSDSDFVPNVEAMVSDNCNIIIGVGFNLEAAIHASAEQNADINYGLVDSTFSSDLKNARPLIFNTAEAAFLAGYAAAGMTKTGTVATFGGKQIPSVSIFMDGFADGVAKYNEAKGKNVKLLGWDKAKQTGSFTNTFDDQALGKQQAQQFLDQGADIIMPVAGPVGLGAAAAIKEAGNAYIIGVDTDWYVSSPDYKSIVLTSVMKEIPEAVKSVIKDAAEGKFTNSPYVGTLENDGVGIAPFHDFDSKVPAELKSELENLTKQIKSGELKIESPNAP
ncbi:BMP family lipoprotein [Trueperella sp. LYQ143]|uniref:BMP family lipoprotein n=1 Tax=unclassified Trueperella TaxID=2630174 RepID=UPI003983CBB7